VLPPGERYRRKQREYCYWGTSYGAYVIGGILPSGERRRAKAINVLLPGDRRRAEVKGVLPLGDVVRGVRHRGNTATGGVSQGESHKRATTGGSPQGGSKGSAAIGGRRTGRTPQGEYCHRGSVAGRKP